jgi:hypothetical protein
MNCQNPDITRFATFSSLYRSALAPAKYAVLAEVDGAYLRTGTATVKLRLPLARTTYDVVLYAVRSHEPPNLFTSEITPKMAASII